MTVADRIARFYSGAVPHDPRECQTARRHHCDALELGDEPAADVWARLGFHAGWGDCRRQTTPPTDAARYAAAHRQELTR